MSKSYWTYAFAASVYLINRIPTPVISMDTPYHKLFGIQPNYDKMCTFGCLCFTWLRPYNSNKLENRSTPCVLLAYSLTQSAYLCLQPISGHIFISRHVQFDKKIFPFRNSNSQSPHPEPTIPETTTHPLPVRVPLTRSHWQPQGTTTAGSSPESMQGNFDDDNDGTSLSLHLFLILLHMQAQTQH